MPDPPHALHSGCLTITIPPQLFLIRLCDCRKIIPIPSSRSLHEELSFLRCRCFTISYPVDQSTQEYDFNLSRGECMFQRGFFIDRESVGSDEKGRLWRRRA